MTHTFDIETELQKIVSMTEIVYPTENYTVNWEDILSELEAYAEKGCAPRDAARFTTDLVRVIRERADYMQRSQSADFCGFTITGEAAEYLTLYALCKVGIASIGENPKPFIQAALIVNTMSVNEYLMNALVEAATSHISEDGEDEIPALIDAGMLLLDETGRLSALLCQARELIEDPAWVARLAIEQAHKSVAPALEM